MRTADPPAVGVVDVARAAVRVGGVDQPVGVVIAIRDADAVAGLRLRVAVVIVGVAGDRAIDRFRLQAALTVVGAYVPKRARAATVERSAKADQQRPFGLLKSEPHIR